MQTNNSKGKVRQLQNKLYLTAKKCNSRRFHALYDKVYRDDVLYEAWKRVKANKGTSGVDGITIEEIIARARAGEYTIADDLTAQPPSQTIIYRYGRANPGNLVPTERDVLEGSGLSFSTLPPAPGRPAVVTTLEALNSTGVVCAVKDGKHHVTVWPVGGLLRNGESRGLLLSGHRQ